MEKFVLHEDQTKAVDFVKSAKCVLLKAPTGAGKTLVAVQSALEVDAKVVLVIAPINTFSGWQKTFERQWQDRANVRIITSKAAGKKAHADLIAGVPGQYIIGREYFKRFAWHKAKHIDFITLDEAHCAVNWKSVMWKMLKTAKAPYKLAMSATPAGNRMEGLWSLCRWLWPQHTPRGFHNWVTEWFETEDDPFKTYEIETAAGTSTVTGKKVVKERKPGALWKALPAAFKMESVYNEKPTIHWIETPMTPTQRKHYKDLEEEAITWLEDNPLAIDIPAVLNMRLRQICLAVPSVRQDWVKRKDKETGLWVDTWGDVVWFEQDAKSSKIDALLEIIADLQAEKPEPVVVYTDSRVFAQIVVQRLQKKGFQARQFIGGMSSEEREWKRENFGVEFDVLVCTIPTVAEGLDSLQHKSCYEIWLNVSWNGLLNTQAQGRLSRQGQTRTVQRFMLVAPDSVETRQLGRLKSSQQLMSEGYGEEEESA